jgi:hypothetical protein
MILGYLIWGQDNKYNMYEDIELDECARYMDVYTINRADVRRDFKKIKSSFSHTYDGFVIVDQKFKNFCVEHQYSGLEFVELNGPYYWLKVRNIVAFDAEGRETRFIGYNEACKGYEEIIGATPAYLKEKKPLSDGFFRTDLCFGSYAGKSPLHMVGEETKRKLEAAGFKKISFEKILDEYP